jgi:predicted MPP superfamily phosphohydrolase
MRRGRGRHYGKGRALVEKFFARLYAGEWPRVLASRHVGSYRVEVSRFTVGMSRWPRFAPPLTIALVSDLHAGPTTSCRALAEAFEKVRDARPDLLLLGGDFVFLDEKYADELVAPLAAIDPPLGKFAVLGNHDLWADDRAIVAALARAKVRVLINEAACVGPIQLVGLDDPWTGLRDPARAFAAVDERAPVVVLSHAAEALALAGDRRFDLLMCGHTHGGQICLPGGIPLYVPGAIGRRYPRGRFDLPTGATLIVTRGVGGVESPFRFYSPPEVVIAELR